MTGVVPADGGGFETPGIADFWQPLVNIGSNGNWSLTRPAVEMLISVAMLGWFFVSVTGKLSVVPTKRQWLAEQVYDFVRNSIARDVIGAKNFRPFIPMVFSVFSLVLVNNVFGVLPFFQFPPTGRVAIPIALTLVVYVTYHVVAVRRKHGFLPYLRSLVPPGLPGWLVPVMFVLELLTFFVVRPVTLALRLFGNMFAGHLLLLVFVVGGEYLLLHGDNLFLRGSGVLSFVFSVVMTFFELFIEFLQAFIFAILTALYLADAVAEEH